MLPPAGTYQALAARRIRPRPGKSNASTVCAEIAKLSAAPANVALLASTSPLPVSHIAKLGVDVIAPNAVFPKFSGVAPVCATAIVDQSPVADNVTPLSE